MPLFGPLIAWIGPFLVKWGGAALWGLRMAALSTVVVVVVKLLSGLGLYFFIVAPAVEGIFAMFQLRFNQLGEIASWVGLMNVDKFFSLVLSAYAIRAVGRITLKRTNA